MMSISWRRASAVVYIYMLYTRICVCVYIRPLTTTTAAWRAIERRARAGDLYMPVKIIDFRSEESQSSTQHIHIQCLTIHSSAPRRLHSTHTQQGRESSTAAYLVSQNIYLGDSQQGEGGALVLSLRIMWCFSLTSANEQERDWGRYRAHSTNRDRHRHKHSNIHSAASAAVSFIHI
jgi:hypothetical protein